MPQLFVPLVHEFNLWSTSTPFLKTNIEALVRSTLGLPTPSIASGS
jgi:hypothetical protein